MVLSVAVQVQFNQTIFWSFSSSGRNPKEELLGIATEGILQTGCPFFAQPTMSIKALKEVSLGFTF